MADFHSDTAHRAGRLPRLRVLAVSGILLLTAGACLPARAQTSTRAAAIGFDIPAGSLAQALNRFAEQSGLQLVYAASLTRGKQTPGVRGTLPPGEALDRLLAGSGLSSRLEAGERVTLEAAPQAGEAPRQQAGALPAVQVSGRAPAGLSGTTAQVALKQNSSLHDTPQSVSVVTREQMEARGAATVSQALRYSAGVVAETRGTGTRYDTVTLRGFGGFGGSASYVNFLDGLRLGRGISYAVPQIDTYDIDNLTLLRGPASVLYGQVSPGGVVVMRSKLPEAEHVNEIEAELGTHRRVQAAFDLGGKVDEDGKVLYRFVGLARDAHTQVDMTRERRYLFAPSVTLKPDADTRLTLYASYQHDPYNGYYGFMPRYGTVSAGKAGELSTSFFDGDPNLEKYSRTQSTFGYEFSRRLNEVWTVRQNTRYMHIASDYETVWSNGYTDASQRYLSRKTTVSYENVDSVSLDNQAQASFHTGPLSHTVLLGLDYQWAFAERRFGQGNAPSLDILNPSYRVAISSPAISSITRQRTDQLGLYAMDQVQWDRWHYTLGLRQDWASTDAHDIKANSATHQFDRAFTWNTGLLYAFDNGIAPYVSYARSFQPVTSGTTASGAPMRPTTGEQYEVGVKYQPNNQPSFVTLSVFDLRQKNVATTDPDNSAYKVQTGAVRSRGAELEGHIEVSPALSIQAAYSYVSAYVASANDSSLGHTPAAVPRHTASLFADYRMRGGALRGLGFGAGVRYVGGTYGAADNAFRVGSYTLFDASVHYDLRQWRFALNASNLFDRRYVAACNSATQCFWGVRREVVASARYQW